MAPLILRELLAGSCRFSELQRSIPLISRSLLAQWLRQMEEDGLLTATEKMTGRGSEYRLTDFGFAAPAHDWTAAVDAARPRRSRKRIHLCS